MAGRKKTYEAGGLLANQWQFNIMDAKLLQLSDLIEQL